jgi:hypothetical protein
LFGADQGQDKQQRSEFYNHTLTILEYSEQEEKIMRFPEHVKTMRHLQ